VAATVIRYLDTPTGIVNGCRHVSHTGSGWYLLLVRATWNSVKQPDVWMALPVLFLTTTRPLIDDPAVIVRVGRTIWADSACGLPEGCATRPALEHPAARIASKMTNSVTSIRRRRDECRFQQLCWLTAARRGANRYT
jgi:hypothetical protein